MAQIGSGRFRAARIRVSRLRIFSAITYVSQSYGPEAARRTVLTGMLFGSKRMATADVNGGMEARFMQGVLPSAPRVEAREHRGRWLLLHWYAHRDQEAVRAVTLIESEDDRVARLRNYFFTPDFIADVCGELGVPFLSNGYRWCLPSR